MEEEMGTFPRKLLEIRTKSNPKRSAAALTAPPLDPPLVIAHRISASATHIGRFCRSIYFFYLSDRGKYFIPIDSP